MFRGEVWLMAVGKTPTSSRGEERKVVILSSDALGALPLKVVVPLTPWKDDYASAPWMVRLPPVLHSGLESSMAADALQVRSVSSARLVKRLGELPDSYIDQIAAAVSLILEGKVAPAA
jgi:mRNA interferase MazF